MLGIEQLTRLLGPLRTRVANIVARAVVTLVKDSKPLQELSLEILAGERASGVERFQNFGHSSNPPIGSEALVLCLGGARDNMIAIAVDDRATRPKTLAPGESILYAASGDFIHLKNGRTIDVVTEAFELAADDVTLTVQTSFRVVVGTSVLLIEADKITLTADAIELNEP